jgi:hypothetical protein
MTKEEILKEAQALNDQMAMLENQIKLIRSTLSAVEKIADPVKPVENIKPFPTIQVIFYSVLASIMLIALYNIMQ